MSFLYGSAELGTPGRQGAVEVVDVSPMVVVSTGVRGARTQQAIDAARERLETWLKSHEAEYEPNGEMRVMAYNSPFVPRDRNFYEVEIPIWPIQ